LKKHLLLASALTAALACAGLGLSATAANAMAMTSAAPTGSAKVVATKNALRGLWRGHATAVRKVVVAKIAGDAAAEKAAEGEVVANAHAIAASIEPYYGAAARDKLFSLLAGHYGAVKAYLDAAVAKDEKAESKATDQIQANADQLASFLSTANPNWPKATLMELLQVHAGHHITQIQQLIAKNAAGEKETNEHMLMHMDVIADALADGLVKQFPQKF
jgi:hypothetical protein